MKVRHIIICIISIILAVLMVLLLFNTASYILTDIGIDIKPMPFDFGDLISILRR